ncbi:MAG: substrate-binding domain-containing protein [Phycisphaerales bacterium]|jgi:LacI family transcriptional regulator|nr:substrate-binding domain-containing protein [Phycisphaerales bacterium]
MEHRKPQSRRPRIFLGQDYYIADVHRGVLEYARQNEWMLDGHYAYFRELNPQAEYDGMIVSLFGVDSPLAKYVASRAEAGVPVVNFSPRPEFPYPQVWEDNRAIGEMAADYLLGCGYRTLVGVGVRPEYHTGALRLDGFFPVCKKAGADVQLLFMEQPGFRDALAALPPMTGIFCADDMVAIRVMELCHQIDRAVPEEFGIIGMGDDELQVYASYVTLSSVNPDYEQRGYRAAGLLDSLMAGSSAPSEPILVPPLGVSARESTAELAIPHAGLAKAVSHLRNHFREPITISDLQGVADLTRRRLQDLFKTHLGCTPLEELTRLRLTQAKLLLRSSTQPIAAIAQQCGLVTAHRLSRLFRQKEGLSPGEFRRQYGRNQ